MKIPVQIVMRNIQTSGALDNGIRDKVAKLERFSSNIVSCRVTVEQTGLHHNHGRQFTVRIDLRLPGQVIEITREHDQDFHVALRDAFLAATRKIEDVEGKRSNSRSRRVAASGEVSGAVGTGD